uniref:Taste receptor type 2 n=1 Tax=Esox lucius TaxID=8010 RepID=A0A6Q2WWN2_ESOLU
MISLFKFLCLTVGSSWATVSYLRRHMESMKESGSPFSSPRLTGQMRVTITGILQGILSLFFSLWLITDFFRWLLSPFSYDNFDSNQNIFFTVASLFMFGTTVNLGVGQSVFRRRAAGICLWTFISCSIWLNFFYCTQIVPAQQVVFIWVKRNIKVIIYWALIVDMVFSLFDGVVEILLMVDINNVPWKNRNDSNYDSVNVSFSTLDDLSNIALGCLSVRMIFLLKFLCLTVGSSWATVSYLRRHMESMKESCSPFSSPRLTGQMRVTITGILQGIIPISSSREMLNSLMLYTTKVKFTFVFINPGKYLSIFKNIT